MSGHGLFETARYTKNDKDDAKSCEKRYLDSVEMKNDNSKSARKVLIRLDYQNERA